ncbi:uncharacterized protein LOC128554741, partial [Mercenaria mercenaria]|uniref:uncharacterized protein LOC128554741 n=1 Tax=Mercenaria mercenaria TaxID=6596 RepID=UPI00234ECD6E
MSTNEDDKEEYFLRASLLLLKGGGLMSKETLNREVQKAGENLDVLLKRHKGNLKHKFSTEQRNKLCLDGGTTCVEQWDLAMLTLVPLTVFKLSLNEDEKKALKCIKYKRDTVYAHTHSSVLSFDDYDDIRNDLEKALHVLSNGLSDYVKDECDKIIQQCTTGPISPSVKAELSKQLKGTEDLVKAVMTKLTDTHKAIMDMRNEIMEKLEKMSMNQDRSEKIIKVICTELTLSGAENESDDIDFVDEIVTTVINKATTKVGNNDYPKIHLAVKNILREIENIPDVKILPAAQKCVLLKFECTTYTSILQMLRYLESESFLELLKELASAVNTDLPDAKGPFRVDATVTTDCMTELLDALRAETSSRYTRSIRMQTEVQTVHGVKHIWSLFEKGGVTNTLQKLSEAVFDELKTRITITPSIDVGQVYDALKEADVQSGGSMQESHVAIRDGAHHHEQIESGSSKH